MSEIKFNYQDEIEIFLGHSVNGLSHTSVLLESLAKIIEEHNKLKEDFLEVAILLKGNMDREWKRNL